MLRTVQSYGELTRDIVEVNRYHEYMRTEMLRTNVFAGNKVPEYFEEETYKVIMIHHLRMII